VCWYNFPSFKIQKAGEVLCVGIAHKTSPAFSTQNFTGLLYFERRKIIPIIYKQFQNKLRSLIEKTRRNSKYYSSQSFRRSGASLAFESNVTTELILLHGDWCSDAYKM
jgi:hypothetical protein